MLEVQGAMRHFGESLGVRNDSLDYPTMNEHIHQREQTSIK